MNTYNWYQTLIKPTWAPPATIFGPVWSVLYAIIFVTFGTVFVKVYKGELPKHILIPFILNILFNVMFTPLQFGLKSNLLAMMDILLVLATLIWAMIAIWPHIKWIVYANLPYLAWVSFATILQITITWINR